MSLPYLWRFLLPEDFEWLHLPRERTADCENCPKELTGEYRKGYRCCTYYPQLPNFQLGLALLNPKTRLAVEAVVRTGHVLPAGMQMTPVHYYRSLESYKEERFGQSAEILCPFMDKASGRCRIHAYRNSVCSTFYCEHDHGASGAAYWNRVQVLLGQIELVLAQWAMARAGMDPEAYISRLCVWSDKIGQTSGDAPNVWSQAVLKQLWDDRFDTQIEFLEACGTAVLNRKDSLYEIACEQTLVSAFQFEKAIEAAAPEDVKTELQPLPEEQPESVPVSDLWYKLQLATRRLWELPFNDGTVGLNPVARIQRNAADTALSRSNKNKPFVLSIEEDGTTFFPRFLTENEASLVRLFESPQALDEALMDNPFLSTVESPRDLLAEWLRLGVLVHRG